MHVLWATSQVLVVLRAAMLCDVHHVNMAASHGPIA